MYKKMYRKMYRNKAQMRNLKKLTPLHNNAGPLFGLQCNALVSLVYFVTYTRKRTTCMDASALCWRPERGLPLKAN